MSSPFREHFQLDKAKTGPTKREHGLGRKGRHTVSFLGILLMKEKRKTKWVLGVGISENFLSKPWHRHGFCVCDDGVTWAEKQPGFCAVFTAMAIPPRDKAYHGV